MEIQGFHLTAAIYDQVKVYGNVPVTLVWADCVETAG